MRFSGFPHHQILAGFVPAALFSVLVALTGTNAHAERNDPAPELKRDPLSSCLHDCRDSDCMRACNADFTALIDRRAAVKEASDQSLLDCAADAFANVTTCSQLFLVPDELDLEGFWDCVSVAGQVFLQCPAIQTSSTPETTAKLAHATLEFMVRAAERDVRFARAGTLKLHPKRMDSTSADAREGTIAAEGGDAEAEAGPTFEDCARDFRANRATCVDLFGDGPGGTGDQGGLSDCNDVAKDTFKACANQIYAQ